MDGEWKMKTGRGKCGENELMKMEKNELLSLGSK